MVDLDPRWVIKLIKMGEPSDGRATSSTSIDQALTLLRAHDNIRCLFTTPKLLEALCEKVSLKKLGITGVFCGGTEMTPQFHRFAVEELLEGAYFAPTYGNTLMGLAVHKPRAKDGDAWDIIYYPPSPRAMIEVVDPDQPDRVVGYGETGRVRLTTLTREFFMPRFLERDEAEREPPCELYPWDGVRNVRPFSRFQARWSRGSTDVLHIPVLRRAGRIAAWTWPRCRTTARARRWPRSARPTPAWCARDLRPERRRRCGPRWRALSHCASCIELCRARGRALRERHAARWATRRRRRTTTSARRRPRPACPTSWCGATWRRSAACWRDMASVLAGLTRGLDLTVLDPAMGEAHGHALSFVPRAACAGRRAAQQLARRPRAVDARAGAQDGAGAEAGRRRALDARTASSRRSCARARRRRRFGFYPTDHAGGGRDPAPLRPRHAVRRRRRRPAPGGAIRASRCTGPATARSLLGPDAAERVGAATST